MQQNKEASLSSLPLEILEHIFSFLHRDDLLQAMSVCTSWKSLILKSSNLWRCQKFTFDCTVRPTKTKRVDMMFCVQTFGHHFQMLTVKCQHPFFHACRKMADQFNLFLTVLNAPELTLLKVSGLRMECTSKIVIKKMCSKLTQMLATNCHLKVFEMPAAHWPTKEGQELLDIVFQKSRNTLETLNIAEYFVSLGGLRSELDWLSAGLTSLTKLTSLSINIFNLTDDLVVALAEARRNELAYLSLWANFVLPIAPHIQQDSWKYLAKACPDMEVELRVVGYVSKAHLSLPTLFESIVLPVGKLKMIINKTIPPFPWPLKRMEFVLDHIRNHYGPLLKSFKMEIDNWKNENFDKSLIKLVRDCPRLVHVKVSASYHSCDTVKTIEKIVTKRRQPPLTCNDQHDKNI
ncbi:F-box only protein 39 [Biomphalaria pfeifferi]|uniref:F-box only protein 39 n=1 Tax=Biomphalaria pfeifferi TaxID=112525 RepID=A0AAD8F4N9_BIOPF|nr:F-box only protein 39 [Biomphalaria pfeifferi]